MADRVVKVTLRAQVAEYIAGMEKATKATRETGTEAEKLAQKKEAFELLGRTAFVMGTVAAAGVALAIAKFAEFDQAMSNVKAVTQESAENMGLLRQAALDFGASSVFTATEAANAIEELGKAGLSTSDILGGALEGSLNLASAGELGIARAAEIAATTLQQFGLDGSQASRVADTLAAGAGKAMGSVEDLANGLKFVGPIAASMGISLEETTGVLAMFAQQGIIGEQAGTSLRGMLSSLTSPSKEARKEIDALGITLYDGQGKFLGLENAAGAMSKAYSGMTDEQRDASLGLIFGNQQVTAARVLYKGGAEDVAKWTGAVKDSGYAAQVARDRLDNLRGDVEALGGAFDTALITTGSAGNDVLRSMTQTLTNLLDLYNAAPEPVKAVALATGALAAAALLAGGAFMLGAPKVAQFNAALAAMGPTAQKAGAMLTASAGPIGIAFAVAGAALAIWAGKQAEAKARTDAFSDTLDKQSGAIQDSTRELVKANLSAKPEGGLFDWFSSGDSVYDNATKLGISIDLVTDAALGNADAMKELRKQLPLAAGSVKDMQDAYAEAGDKGHEYLQASKAILDAVDTSTSSLHEAARVTMQKASLDSEAAKKAGEHTTALGALEGKASETTNAVGDLAAAIRGFGSAALSVRDANRNLEAAYDSLTDSINANGSSLDIGTDKGRANQSALDNIAKAALEAAAATYEQTGSQAEANAVLEAGRARLIEMLAPFGIVGDAASAYVDELGLIPENIDTAVALHTAEAKAAIDQFVRDLNNIPGRRDVVINEVIRQTGQPRGAVGAAYNAKGSVMDFYADGGMRENHVAQIAPAGSWRVWGEPETGGEAYIPLAMSKRARSLDIWRETGNRLGVRGFAGGGFMQPQYVSGGGGGGAVTVNPQVSLAGAVIQATLDGRPIGLMIQSQIVQANQSSAATDRAGRQVR